MKRLIYMFTAAAMLLSLMPCNALGEADSVINTQTAAPSPAYEQEAPPSESTPTPEAASTAQAQEYPFANITTPYLYLMEAETGTLLYSRNGNTRVFPASTTKIMSALVAIENLPDLNKYVTIGWRPVAGFAPANALMGLAVGEQVSIMDMLYGMLMCSANDAAKALAIEAAYAHFGDSINPDNAVSLFVSLMNEKAEELGMSSTHFATVDGRHDDNHYTTAHDFAILMAEAIKNPVISKIIATPNYKVDATAFHPNGFFFENSNRLICTKSTDTDAYLYEYCIGGKTGETNAAGYCLLSAAKKDEVTLILAQFGDNNTATTSYYRFQNAALLYDWGFQNYRAFELSEFSVQTDFELTAQNFSPFDSENGKFIAKASVDGLSITGAYANMREYLEDPALIVATVDPVYSQAPIRKGDVVGYVDYHFYEGASIRASLIAQRDVASASDFEVEPHSTAFISFTPPSASGKKSKLRLERRTGDKQYDVWHYYDGSLYTDDSTQWHYLQLTGDVFSTVSTDNPDEITLYRRYFDSNSKAYYRKEDSVTDGGEYAIVIDKMALTASSKGGSLKGAPVTIGSDGLITEGISDNMIWRFSSDSSGYRIANASRFLARKGASGVLFWALVLALVFAAFIIIRIFLLRKKHSRRRRNAKRYRAAMR